MSEIYGAFASARLDYDELPDHARDRCALAVVLKAVAAHLAQKGYEAGAGELRAILDNWRSQ